MIKNITVTNHLNQSVGLSLTDPWDTGLIIKSIDGLGPPKATINYTELATGDGAAYNSARIGTRNIVFNFKFTEVVNDTNEVLKTIEQVRLDTYRYFPLKKRVKMTFETDSRVCYILGYVESNEPVIFGDDVDTQISIVCDDPFFYAKSKQIRLNASSGDFEFPFSNESLDTPLINFGDVSSGVGQNVKYVGDAESGIIVSVNATGVASNIIISNTNSHESMTIDTTKIGAIFGDQTSTLIAGDILKITSITGQKKIELKRNGVTKNLLACISRSSDWLHLVNGDNVFTFQAEGADNVIVSIDGYTLYEGI